SRVRENFCCHRLTEGCTLQTSSQSYNSMPHRQPFGILHALHARNETEMVGAAKNIFQSQVSSSWSLLPGGIVLPHPAVHIPFRKEAAPNDHPRKRDVRRSDATAAEVEERR